MNKSVQLCFEIISRYFPEQSGRTEEATKLFGICADDLEDAYGQSKRNSLWKKAACDWLASNLQVKPTKPAKRPARKSVKK